VMPSGIGSALLLIDFLPGFMPIPGCCREEIGRRTQPLRGTRLRYFPRPMARWIRCFLQGPPDDPGAAPFIFRAEAGQLGEFGAGQAQADFRRFVGAGFREAFGIHTAPMI
jgi:hypothetical protein